MDREEIIKLAREAGFSDTTNPFVAWGASWEQVERFAALVAAHERRACVKVCDAVQKKNEDDGAWMWEARNCAAAIRARGEK